LKERSSNFAAVTESQGGWNLAQAKLMNYTLEYLGNAKRLKRPITRYEWYSNLLYNLGGNAVNHRPFVCYTDEGAFFIYFG